MDPIVVAAVVAGAVLTIGLLTMSVVVERAEVRESLRRLEGYQIPDVRDQEMLAPIGERVFAPVLGGLAGIAQRFTPNGYREQVTRKLLLAGSPANRTVDQILVLKLLGLISGLLWIPLILAVVGLSGLLGFGVVAALWGVCFMGADVSLSRVIATRQHDIAVQLPDILDLLTISVEAGLGFEQALDRTTTAVPGPLSDEFRRMLRETRYGASRAEALRAIDERCDVPELRTFIMAMLQADTFGISIARLLRAQADDMRIRRRLRAQEQAQKAPVKMLFPLVFCIFPSIFVVILGPAMISIMRNFANT